MQTARGVLPRAVAWPALPLLLAATFAADIGYGGGDASATGWSDVPQIIAMVACWLVGVVVTARAPRQPAGWAFLGLGTAIAWSAFTDVYAGAAVDHHDVPAWRLVATFSDTSFVWWFVPLALVLLFTAPGGHRGVARWLPAVTIVTGAVYQVAALLRSTPLDPPFDDISSPLTVSALDGPAKVVAATAVFTVGACLLASVVILVRAWRRATGEARQQLLWLVAGALPLIPAVIAAFAFSFADHPEVAGAALGFAMVALVIGAGLSVLRYRLYDVERVVTESAAYAIASAAVLIVYLTVVIVISRTGPLDTGSQLATISATLAGVGAARVSFVWGRRAVGRRVSPRRFRAVEAMRSGLAAASSDLNEVLAAALGPGVRVVYPAPGDTWVTSDGLAADPAPDGVDVRRRGELVGRLVFDPRDNEREIVEAVADEAAAEIDNIALRAKLARQLELVRESRARLETAHLEERRRIERDLHDGAQQRLLALALQLQSAKLNGDDAVIAAETDRAIAELQATVQELRSLAAGLQPAALAGGGLLAAVADLAARTPIPVDYDVVDARFPSDIESAAWFVVAEAVTNAVKHSGAQEVAVEVRRTPECLDVEIRDLGCGGADPSGSGLQGLADRVAALGGTLGVRDAEPDGTIVKAAFPCAS